MKIKINPDGMVEMLYTEKIDIASIGKIIDIRRASHVEPTAEMQWISDMTVSGGPVLGPYDIRSEALAAEIDWLEREKLA